ncbi:hypothetical protein RRG08_012347 [Elysia crispata]|uniref:Uncharacterized protein n=1 Tax=Elysia crispata TaxID=231223 RepID=A0AAE1ABM5_9GAST|nr:hypothetical protein RRG08_012347 [Elysia crispata]
MNLALAAVMIAGFTLNVNNNNPLAVAPALRGVYTSWSGSFARNILTHAVNMFHQWPGDANKRVYSDIADIFVHCLALYLAKTDNRNKQTNQKIN